ncbi:MAG TPA: bifunctional UDP-N-acetylglucosamine diphosphorylase/glucosamine-1-phosphate N-acetyltransferase GlmU, partial [Nitrolancea sp.]|nr:bifunctional UDP-N-acetylglucosamine diphosphorylase/glucosamine-1-phosphate N-acetyltransferase GlmU [Nitrolancea sp.]
ASVVESLPPNCEVVWQHEPLGTGHAAAQALPVVKPHIKHVAILFGDHPLLTGDAVSSLIARARESNALVTLLTAILDDPGAYGRLQHDGDRITGVIEAKADQTIYDGPVEIYSGISCYQRAWLDRRLPTVPRSAVGEYYLTSLVSMAAEETNEPPVVSVVAPAETAYGINDRVELAVAERLMRSRINERLMRSGVTIVDPATTYIDDTVEIGADTRIEPMTTISGVSQIGEQSVIGPGAIVRDTSVGADCVVVASTLEGAVVGDRVHVGPYAHFRAGTIIESDAHIGNYVETKNARIGSGTHVGHFSYLGDAEIGQRVNIAAGTITANYDGVAKHQTIIADDAFIGCDTILRAPVSVGTGGKTGAGSVVTHDVAPGETVIGVPARPFGKKPHSHRNGGGDSQQ